MRMRLAKVAGWGVNPSNRPAALYLSADTGAAAQNRPDRFRECSPRVPFHAAATGPCVAQNLRETKLVGPVA